MPFGLKTAPATFQRAMEVTLAGLTFEICLCYLDDVIVFGQTLTEHKYNEGNRSRARVKMSRAENFGRVSEIYVFYLKPYGGEGLQADFSPALPS